MKTTHTILIVDDDIDILEALKIYLSKDEYRLLTARNGQDAVDIVRAACPVRAVTPMERATDGRPH